MRKRKSYLSIFSHNRVESTFSIPYTSLLASSVDASTPARVVVENEDIKEYLNVRYIHGAPPKNGKIVVSSDLFKAYDYFEADVVNDLYFQASRMTYFPLRVSGIFECSDKNSGYVFVTEKPQKK